jgi:hypothetical protein
VSAGSTRHERPGGGTVVMPAAWLAYRGGRLMGDVEEFHGTLAALEADTRPDVPPEGARQPGFSAPPMTAAASSTPCRCRSAAPLLVLRSEHSPRPWSTRCRSCPWASEHAASLLLARLAFAIHRWQPAAAVDRQAAACLPIPPGGLHGRSASTATSG